MRALVEDVEFTDEEDFTEKLNTLKENYFPKSVATQTLEEEVETDNQEVDVSGLWLRICPLSKSQNLMGLRLSTL